MSKFFNKQLIDELVEIAQHEGWEIMVNDVYNLINLEYSNENKEDRFTLMKTLINEVGFVIKQKLIIKNKHENIRLFYSRKRN